MIRVMKSTFKSLVLGIALLVGGSGICLAQDLDAGVAAYGRGDYATAYREFRVLAAQGNAEAQHNLGLMYESGRGVTQDYREAVRWYRLSAEQSAKLNDREAQDFIRVMCPSRMGLKEIELQLQTCRFVRRALYLKYNERANRAYSWHDYNIAFQEYKFLAEQGYANAQSILGLMYYDGLGVTQDYEQALKWFQLSAEQGDRSAQFKLGLIYYNGQGIAQDHSEAMRWFRLSAEQGSTAAMNNLGLMYEKGQGVTQDYVYAHMWTSLAAENLLDDSGARNRDIIAREMTREQLTEAQRLARECRQKNYKSC